MKIFCYRDLLIGGRNQSAYIGVTLYFAENADGSNKAPTRISSVLEIVSTLADRLKTTKKYDVGKDLEKILARNNPIVGFVQKCIESGVKKTRCYFDAKSAGIKIRKQDALALYDYLSLRREISQEPTETTGKPSFAFFREIQEEFADQMETNTGLTYMRSQLSECTADDIDFSQDISLHDFLFEIGDLMSGKLKYHGQWRGREWIIIRLFEEFDTDNLEEILRGRKYG